MLWSGNIPQEQTVWLPLQQSNWNIISFYGTIMRPRGYYTFYLIIFNLNQFGVVVQGVIEYSVSLLTTGFRLFSDSVRKCRHLFD